MKHALVRAGTLSPIQSQRMTRRSFMAWLPGSILFSALVVPHMGMSAGIRNRLSSSRPSRPLVYVVDDNLELTELCRIFLEAAGYEVRTFTDRVEALTSFLGANPKPALLITDYDGYPISAEQLMQCCRTVQPGLKILMASGYDESCLSSCRVMPDRFLEKPFSSQALLDEVQSLIRKSHGCDSAIRSARFLNNRRIE